MNFLNTIYKNACFVCIKETSQRDVSFTLTKHMCDRKKPKQGLICIDDNLRLLKCISSSPEQSMIKVIVRPEFFYL